MARPSNPNKSKGRKARVALTLPPEIDIPLTHLSKLTNQPKTAIITELLTDVIPLLNEAIKAIEGVKQGQREAIIEKMAEFVGNANAAYSQAKIDFDLAKDKTDDK